MRTGCEEIRFVGDCLEKIGIPNGGIALVDYDEIPRVFDVVLCETTAGGITPVLKQVLQVVNNGSGLKHIVHTRHIDRERDYMFWTPHIFGVVLQVKTEDGVIVWERPEPEERMMVVHAYWEPYTTSDGVRNFRCSACRKFRFHNGEMRRKYKHCPECAAKMDGEAHG